MVEVSWVVKVSWPESGRDLDLFTTVSSGGQTTSGIGWNNGSQTSVIEVDSGGIVGTFYAKWGGDNTQWGGFEIVTVYFKGTLPSGHTQVAIVTPHCNYYGEGSGSATVTVEGQSGSYIIGSPSTNYRNRATADDPYVNVPLYADEGTPEPFPNLVTVTLDANGGSVSPSSLYYIDPTSSTKYGTIPSATRQNCTFLGWFTSRVGGTQVTDSSTLASLSSHTIYAHWNFEITVITFASYGTVTLNGVESPSKEAGFTYILGNFEDGDTITIKSNSKDQSTYPFRAWYLNPSELGNPDGTGTIISGAGETYTTTVTAPSTFFATFVVHDVYIQAAAETPYTNTAVISINGQNDGTDSYSASVPSDEQVTIEATDYGGPVYDFDPEIGKMFFDRWVARYSSDETISLDRIYTFSASLYGNGVFYAIYATYWKLKSEVSPDSSAGSISIQPTSARGDFYKESSTVVLTAIPSRGNAFLRWTRVSNGHEMTISTSAQLSLISTEENFDYTYVAYFGHTHLLVNSYDKSTPVTLVYDQSSGILVADY